jgi:hypothetical protein
MLTSTVCPASGGPDLTTTLLADGDATRLPVEIVLLGIVLLAGLIRVFMGPKTPRQGNHDKNLDPSDGGNLIRTIVILLAFVLSIVFLVLFALADRVGFGGR